MNIMAAINAVNILNEVISDGGERPPSLTASNTDSQNYRILNTHMIKINRTTKLILVIISILVFIVLSSYNVSRIQELIGAPKTHSVSSENRGLTGNFTKYK